ncbi:MAG TPA: TonB-dependent receptor [Rhodanobacter sp.]|jgi:iron complex outermembrane receptor protein|nr:TonB-dependent receptor [Rhodanobacter sp.]
MSFSANRRTLVTALSLALCATPLAVYAQVSYNFNLPVQSLADSLRAVGSKASVDIAFEPATVQGRNAPALKGSYSARQALDRLLEGSGLVLRTTQGGSFLVEAAHAPGSVANPTPRPSKAYNFDIPSQSLAATLQTIKQTTGQRIDFDTKLISQDTASAISGHLTTVEAIQQALVGTGLHAEVTPSGVRIAHADSTPAFGGVRQESEVFVVAQAENTYNVSSSNSATRTDTDLLDTPQSVSVITRKLLDDQQVQTMDEALANASGVLVDTSLSTMGSVYTIRGFGNASVMNDGLSGTQLPSQTPIWAVDSIEVLKGPESILAGAATNQNFGGTINIVAKQPQATPVAAMMLGVGSYGQAQAGFDLGDALTDNKQLSYRLVGQLDRANNDAAGYDGKHEFYLAPSLRWGNEATSLLVGAERSVTHAPLGLTTVVTGVKPDDSAPLRVIGAVDDGNVTNQTRGYFKFEQTLFNSDWSFRSRGQYLEQGLRVSLWGRLPLFIDPDFRHGNILLQAKQLSENMRSYAIQNDITGKFSTGDFSHQIVIGSDFQYTSTVTDLAAKAMSAFNIYTSPPLQSVSSFTRNLFAYNATGHNSEVGYFFQDQISYGEKWHALIALRDAIYHSYDSTIPDKNKWLPNLGLLYKLSPNIAAYVSSMQGYAPNFYALTPEGKRLPPMESKQHEAGLKFDLMDKHLSLTTAVYQIKINNNPIGIPGTPFSEVGPGQTSKGVEIELKGQLAPGLDLSSTFTHTIVKTSDGTPATANAKNTMSLWAGYQFQQAPLKNWSVGLGVFARSAALNQRSYYGPNGENLYMKNPGNVRTDLHIGYTGHSWSVNFGIRDIFDRRNYSVDSQDWYAGVQDAGRTYMLTSKINF